MAGKTRNEASSSTSNIGSRRGESVVVDCRGRRSSCGYCRSSGRTSISHGLWAYSLTVDDYQGLLDRGWRRSGCFLYKPEMERTCCPSYTIRLKADDFVPSKEQVRVSKRMQRFLDGTLNPKKPDMDEQKTSEGTSTSAQQFPSSEARAASSTSSKEKSKEEQRMCHFSDLIDNVACRLTESGEFPCHIQLPKASVKKVSQGKRKLTVEGSEDLLYTSNIAFQIAAAIRRVHSQKDNPQLNPSKDNAGETGFCSKSVAERIANLLNSHTETFGMSTRACNGHINFYSPSGKSLDEDVQVSNVSRESAMSRSKGCSLEISSGHTQVKKRKLEIIMKRSTFDPEEYELYRRYQIKVHNDKPDHVTESSYKRFLVDTPLVFVPPTGDGTVPPCGFGSFHQQYVIDGRLIAVGVIDILPKCLSSKYLFWDPEFAFLSLGKYSALQEIGWVKENQAHCPTLQYYYLGYYIHSCRKMRYKAAYYPSELLCPLRYKWVPFDTAKPLLDRQPYVVLSDHAILQKGESSNSHISHNVMEVQHDDDSHGHSNDVFEGRDEVMIESETESSDDESFPETANLSSNQKEDDEISNIVIGLNGPRVRYKDIPRALRANAWGLESQLRRYRRVVGAELSERMVYSLG